MVGFPLLLIPLAIYNIIVFLMPDLSFTDPLVKLSLVSGAEWTVTLSDVLLTLAMGYAGTALALRAKAAPLLRNE